MSAERQIPGGVFVNEVGEDERQIPGGPFVNETVAAGGATAYTLDAGAGSYSLSGQAATLNAAWSLNAAAGSYTLSGQAASLNAAWALNAAAGSYTLTGQAATLNSAWALNAAAGAYTLTGADADLTYTPYVPGATHYSLDAASGTYTLTGADITANLAWAFNAAAGSYTLNGADAALGKGQTLSADAGSYTLTGGDTGYNRGYSLFADYGTYTINGADADLSTTGTTTSVVTVRTEAGGSIRDRGRKKRTVVEIDGKLVEVRGVREAQALIKELREEALEEAPKIAKAALNKAREVERKTGELPEVEIEPPQIRVIEASDWVAGEFKTLQDQIQKEYANAVQAQQLALLARRKYFEDDEEDAILALMA